MGGDNDVLDVELVSSSAVPDGIAFASSSAASRLRRLVAANATMQCMSCMLLPCICPADDEVESESMIGGDAAAIAASPSATDAFPDQSEELNDVQDAIGRVRLITSDASVGHRDVWIARELKRQLRPHQIKGVQFLYDNAAANQGCILADYMGLGKTLQVITVIYSFMTDEVLRHQAAAQKEEADDEKVSESSPPPSPPCTMVLCPAICIPNWQSEFNKWLCASSLARLPVLAFDATAGKGTTASRLRLLHKWKRDGGVLLMGYELYRSLLNPTLATASMTSLDRDANIQVCTRVSTSTMEITHAATTKLQKSAKEFHRILCNPGADLVVLDEGHRLKDPTSLLCQSVAKIQSKRRLVLTGYPVQNSLAEYWCMVNFAREDFLGSYDTFRSRYERPIVDGNRARAKELIHKLKGVVLRRGQALLKKQLPPKSEWILYCKLSPLQHRLYSAFLSYYSDTSAGKATADLLTAYAALLQVMNHPDIIHHKLTLDDHELVEDDDLDGSMGMEVVMEDESVGWTWESEEKLQERRQHAADQVRKRRQKAMDRQRSYEWARATILGEEENTNGTSTGPRRRKLPRSESSTTDETAKLYQSMVLENSGKMAVLLQIIEESFALDDKVVVFSQSVPTLKVITDFLLASKFNPSIDSTTAKHKLKQSVSSSRRKLSPSRRDPAGLLRKKSATSAATNGRKAGGNSNGNTVSDAHRQWFLQIDGSTSGAKRMDYIHAFSTPTSSVKLLLVSTRAGAEGINLHAANRLVLFDVSWNPSNDHQAMCRSHRIGQAKDVHVYRLVSTGTMERMIYEQQMKKVNLSTHVVDDKQQQQQVAAETLETPPTCGDSTIALTGFLHPPSKTDKTLEVDPAVLEGDAVLVQCVAKAGHWLVDIVPAHDMDDDEPADEEEFLESGAFADL